MVEAGGDERGVDLLAREPDLGDLLEGGEVLPADGLHAVVQHRHVLARLHAEPLVHQSGGIRTLDTIQYIENTVIYNQIISRIIKSGNDDNYLCR